MFGQILQDCLPVFVNIYVIDLLFPGLSMFSGHGQREDHHGRQTQAIPAHDGQQHWANLHGPVGRQQIL
jgi:hypothetical protein